MQILNKKESTLRNSKGFTLIELLVVIAIIGILASIMVVSLTNAQKKARDAKRQSELNQLRTALTLYADDNNAGYPTTTPATTTPTGTTNSVFDPVAATNPIVNEYMATALLQVGNAAYSYEYRYTAGPPAAYAAYVLLEAPPTTTYYCIDSRGKAGTVATAPSTSVCP